MGGGFDTDWAADGRRFRSKYSIESPFLLYAGRREPGKNIDLLIHFWRRYKKQTSTTALLVLIGPGDLEEFEQED